MDSDTGLPEDRHCRSKSNHRCCFNSRFRAKETRKFATDTSSSGSSSISHHKRSSTSDKASSGYGCSDPKRPRLLARSKRPIHSSHVTHLKSNHTTEIPKTSHIPANEGRSRCRSNSSKRSGGTRNSKPDKADQRNSNVHLNGHCVHGHTGKGKQRDLSRSHKKSHAKHLVSRKKEQKRHDEKVHRKDSHERHKRMPSPIVPVGDVIKRRFRVEKILGEGSYGQVFECFDLYTSSKAAIKALKPQSDYNDAARHEVSILEMISMMDTKHRSHCISFIDCFEWHQHFFIVFPLMGISIYSFLEKNNFEPYPLDQSAIISRQVCEAVAFMHRIGITHTDLKPENILFVDSAYDEVFDNSRGRALKRIINPNIKLIDFGSATHDNDHHSTIIQTRHYRAPEVVMELCWNQSADVWSIGCIVFELVTGQCLFMTHDNLEHLAMMERVLGPIPKCLTKASRRKRYFRHGRLDWSPNSSDSRYVRRVLKPLGEYWFSSRNLHKRLAFDLVKEMLVYISSDRISCAKSLEHPFILS